MLMDLTRFTEIASNRSNIVCKYFQFGKHFAAFLLGRLWTLPSFLFVSSAFTYFPIPKMFAHLMHFYVKFRKQKYNFP